MHIQVFYSFWVNCCAWCNILIIFHSFLCGWPVFPELFVEKTVLSSLSVLGTLVEKSVDHVCECSSLGSILIHWSICLSYASAALHHFHFYSFVVSFEVAPTLWEFFNFYSSFSRLFWPFEVPCNFYGFEDCHFHFYEEVSWACHRNCCTYRSLRVTETF